MTSYESHDRYKGSQNLAGESHLWNQFMVQIAGSQGPRDSASVYLGWGSGMRILNLMPKVILLQVGVRPRTEKGHGDAKNLNCGFLENQTSHT